MRLGDLLEVLPDARLHGDPDLEITGLSYDSRLTTPGSLFVAIRGFVHDGHDFIGDAYANGARAVVVEREGEPDSPVPWIRVPSSRRALAMLSAQFYGHPSKELRLIGVTGTNGKTTTTHLIRSILMAQGHKVGLIGTVHNYVGDEKYPVTRTTPESLDLQSLFRQMVEAGCKHCVMEVSSHALELHRVDSCEFDVGVFTNLSQDHLDFHQNFSNYLEAKAKLFESLGRTYLGTPKPGGKSAIVNLDDPAGRQMAERTWARVTTYGLSEESDIRAIDISLHSGGASFRLLSPKGERDVRLQISGRFNVYNTLAAIGAGLAEGVPLDAAVQALEGVTGVAGRLEGIDLGQDFRVFVDYAHTPDGLENVLLAVRELARGRVIVVFGAGGDRDRTKRPIMGKLAARLADYCIITSDNPRSEDPDAIVREIEKGVRHEGKDRSHYASIVDREEAIAGAIEMAEPGDVVLIAGKGHETYQIFRDRTIHFDDREVAEDKIRRRSGRAGR